MAEESKAVTDDVVLHHNPFNAREPLVGGKSTRTAEEKFETSPATTPEGIVKSDKARAARGDK